MGSPLLDYAKQRHLPIPLETRTARFGFALCELKYFLPLRQIASLSFPSIPNEESNYHTSVHCMFGALLCLCLLLRNRTEGGFRLVFVLTCSLTEQHL